MAKASEFPDEGELVVCTVKNVKNFGSFVSLDEYEGKEGFIHIRDVATGWVKYIRDYVREGQKIVCKVLGVDPGKGHIDLSLKSVNEHQKREKIQQWKNENKAEKLLSIVADRMGSSLEKVYDDFGYDLLDTFGTLYSAFEQAAVSRENLVEEGIEGDWIDAFVEVAQENVTPPYVQIDGYLDLSCPTPDGVDRIKDALVSGMEMAEESMTIQYVGAPRYRMMVTATDYKSAEEDMKKVADHIVEQIDECGGEAEFKRET
ncbi:MAG: translation initiation factor IF-2 subunit alpha [Methanomassiliicoccales archaeon]